MDNATLERVNRAIDLAYDMLINQYGHKHILGVFLYGSQNYNLDTPTSDVDIKAIYVPDLYEVSCYKAPLSKVIKYPYGQIEIKDIREMAKMWKKQSINFLEILFTAFYRINPMYYKDWVTLVTHKEDITRYDERRAILAAAHQALGIYDKKFCTGKDYANILRLCDFLSWYRSGVFSIRVYHTDRDKCMSYKTSTKMVDLSSPEALVHKTYLQNCIADTNYITPTKTSVNVDAWLAGFTCECIKICSNLVDNPMNT